MPYDFDTNIDYDNELSLLKTAFRAEHRRMVEQVQEQHPYWTDQACEDTVREKLKQRSRDLYHPAGYHANKILRDLPNEYQKILPKYKGNPLYHFFHTEFVSLVNNYHRYVRDNDLSVAYPDFQHWEVTRYLKVLAESLAISESLMQPILPRESTPPRPAPAIISGRERKKEPKVVQVPHEPSFSQTGRIVSVLTTSTKKPAKKPTSKRTTAPHKFIKRDAIVRSLIALNAVKIGQLYEEICALDMRKSPLLSVIGAFHFVELISTLVEEKSLKGTLQNRDYLIGLGYRPDEAKKLVKPANEINDWANVDKHDAIRGSFGNPSALITEFDAMSGPIEKMLQKHLAAQSTPPVW